MTRNPYVIRATAMVTVEMLVYAETESDAEKLSEQHEATMEAAITAATGLDFTSPFVAVEHGARGAFYSEIVQSSDPGEYPTLVERHPTMLRNHSALESFTDVTIPDFILDPSTDTKE